MFSDGVWEAGCFYFCFWPWLLDAGPARATRVFCTTGVVRPGAAALVCPLPPSPFPPPPHRPISFLQLVHVKPLLTPASANRHWHPCLPCAPKSTAHCCTCRPVSRVRPPRSTPPPHARTHAPNENLPQHAPAAPVDPLLGAAQLHVQVAVDGHQAARVLGGAPLEAHHDLGADEPLHHRARVERDVLRGGGGVSGGGTAQRRKGAPDKEKRGRATRTDMSRSLSRGLLFPCLPFSFPFPSFPSLVFSARALLFSSAGASRRSAAQGHKGFVRVLGTAWQTRGVGAWGAG